MSARGRGPRSSASRGSATRPGRGRAFSRPDGAVLRAPARRHCCAPRKAGELRATAAAHGGAIRQARSWPPRPIRSRLVSGGDDGRVVADGRRRRDHESRRSAGGGLDRRPGATPRRLGRLRRGQAGRGARREGSREDLRGALDRPRPRLRAEGISTGDRALRRRDPVVPQSPGRPRTPRLEGLAPRRDLVAGRALRGHEHAGERAARLAPPARPRPHAHVRLPGQGALRRLVAGRQVARVQRRRGGDRLALRLEGGADGQGAPRDAAPGRPGSRASPIHPKAPVLAAGYEDGCILLIRFNDASELLVRRRDAVKPRHGSGLGHAPAAPGLRLRRRPGRHPDHRSEAGGLRRRGNRGAAGFLCRISDGTPHYRTHPRPRARRLRGPRGVAGAGIRAAIPAADRRGRRRVAPRRGALRRERAGTGLHAPGGDRAARKPARAASHSGRRPP